MLSLVYKILFALSVILINPWGEDLDFIGTGRAEVWTYPKVSVVVLITAINLWIIASPPREKAKSTRFSQRRRIASGLWLAYLLAAAVSTLHSPFPAHSLLGHSVLGDGLLYWILIAGFVLTNTLALEVYPNLLEAQLGGVLLGGFILSLSIFPQVFDWRIDYTVTSGQVSSFNEELLESYIWRNQMPIGLYTNRGYAAYVLALTTCLSLIGLTKRTLSNRLMLGIVVATVLALLFTQIQAAIISFFAIAIYFLVNYYTKVEQTLQIPRKVVLILSALLISLLSFQIYENYEALQADKLAEFSSSLEITLTGRLYLWKTACQGILARPIWGWGFNGFGIAHLFVGDWQGQLGSFIPEGTVVNKVTALYETTFDYVSADGELYSGVVFTHKAHNLVLDTLLSVGMIGFFCYSSLIVFYIWQLATSNLSSYLMTVVLYLLFTVTWYETAQFTHLFWWTLSFGLSQRTPSKGD